MKKSQSGFTLVELIVVILVLGILSATALPRFMNVSDQAHTAAVSGAGGGFGSAVALVKAQHIANGTVGATTAVANFGDGTVSVNDKGWPVNINGQSVTDYPNACVKVWENIMQNPPSVAVSDGTNLATDYDYLVAESSGASSSLSGCTYQYSGASGKKIEYDAATGKVTITK